MKPLQAIPTCQRIQECRPARFPRPLPCIDWGPALVVRLAARISGAARPAPSLPPVGPPMTPCDWGERQAGRVVVENRHYRQLPGFGPAAAGDVFTQPTELQAFFDAVHPALRG